MATTTKPEATIQLVPHTAIRPSPLNPRKRFDADQMDELAESILQEGLLQNLVVRQVGTAKKAAFEIAAGERRWRAIDQLHKAKQLPKGHPLHAGVPVIVRRLTDLQLLQLATTENLARADMTPMEEARAFQQMLELGSDVETIAAETGFSQATVRKRLALVERLSPVVVELLEKGLINLAQAQAFTTAGTEAQEQMLRNRYHGWEQLDSVRAAGLPAEDDDQDDYGEELEDGKGGEQVELQPFDSAASQIREVLRRQSVPVSRAMFALSRYEGAIVQPGFFDSQAEPTFDDVDQFHRLQAEWVEETVARLTPTVGWVEVRTGWFNPWDYVQATEGDDPKLVGVVIQYDQQTGTVKLHEGVKRRVQERTTRSKASDADPLAMSQRHLDVVHQERTKALQLAMATGDPRAALATMCVSMASIYHWAGYTVHREGLQTPWHSPEVLELREALASEHHRGIADGVGAHTKTPHAEAMAALLELPLEKLLEVFQVLVALGVRTGYGVSRNAAPVAEGIREVFDFLGAQLPTYRALGADYLALNSKTRIGTVAKDLLDPVAAGEVKGKPRKQVIGRILASAGAALDQVPPELQMPEPPKPKASKKTKGEEVDDAA